MKIKIRMCLHPNHNLNHNLNQKTVVPGMSISDKSLKKVEVIGKPTAQRAAKKRWGNWLVAGGP